MVVKDELRNQGFNLKIVQEEDRLETSTIDDMNGLFWLDIITLLLSKDCGIMHWRSNDLHKKLSKEEILQWFQTMRSSVFLLNSMLEYRQKVSDLYASGVEQQTKIGKLQLLNQELMNHELMAQKHATKTTKKIVSYVRCRIVMVLSRIRMPSPISR